MHGVYIKNNQAYCGNCRGLFSECVCFGNDIGKLNSPENKQRWREEYGKAISSATKVIRDDRQRLRNIGIPDALHVAVLRPKDTEALMQTKSFLLSERKALVLCGKTGCGKSVAASWSALDYCKQSGENNTYEPALFASSRELARTSDFDKTHERMISKAKRVPYLVLDDVGQESTEFGRNKINEIIITRLDANLRTVVTSNATPKDLTVAFGQAITDRLRATGQSAVLVTESLRVRL